MKLILIGLYEELEELRSHHKTIVNLLKSLTDPEFENPHSYTSNTLRSALSSSTFNAIIDQLIYEEKLVSADIVDIEEEISEMIA